MESLTQKHLTTLSLIVDFRGIARIGTVPAGTRGIAPVTGGRFEGERLSGAVLGGHDWFLVRPDGVMMIDVRLTLKTDDGAMIYLAYQGRFLATPENMARFNKGQVLDRADYDLTISAKLECGDARYAWLNDVMCVGSGEQTATGPIYTLFDIG